jgi:hypothetical protein
MVGMDIGDHFLLIMKTRFAMALGRPSYISDNKTTVLTLTAADCEVPTGEQAHELAQTTVSTGKHCFVAMAALTIILDEVLATFFTISSLVSLRKATDELIIDISNTIDQKLGLWCSTHLDQVLIQRFFPDVTGERFH